MITESDVRAVLTEQAHDVSEPADILARLTFDRRPHRLVGRRSPDRRRWLAPVAAAAAVAAVVVGGITIAGTNQHKQSRPTDGHTLPPMGGIELRYVGSIGPVPNYQVDGTAFTADRQITNVTGHRLPRIAQVTVYAEGAFDPATIRQAQRVTVGGVHALFGDVVTTDVSVGNVPTLAWRLGSGRWITVTGWWPSILAPFHLHLDPLTEAKRIAAAIDTSVSRPFLVPFRVGYLPAGLERAGGEYLRPDASSWADNVEFRAAPGGSGGLVNEIAASPANAVDQPSDTFTLNGHPAWIDTTSGTPATGEKQLTLHINFGQMVVSISATGLSRDELIKVGRSVSVASKADDDSTWFDAAR